jgi:iron complex transport system substrate-binding protein
MRFFLLFLTALFVWPQTAATREITDALGRKVEIPDKVERVICSGSGCLRLLTYLQAQDMVVAVDDIESRRRQFDARPYAMANPQFKSLPVFGEFRGKDNPELIMTLDPGTQVILKLVGTGKGTVGMEPGELQGKTGIPVVALKYGNLGKMKEELYGSLRIMADVVGKQQRAIAICRFFDDHIADLKKRTADIPEARRPSVYLGGVAYAGPHGFQSTEPTYPPFRFVNARNLADHTNPKAGEITSTDIAKEKLVEWNPDYLFLDLSTLQFGDQAGGLYELKTDPACQTLTAVKTGKVYGVLPYNLYNQNFESIFADAYFIGTLLYPERFADIDPAAKADESFTFLVGRPVFAEMNARFQGLAFRPVPLK